MRLEKVKLAGFKSFVEPTNVSFPGNLVGIVGPNGSGKSNIIDAIRWVMGESSAKQLRGELLADVIFNGSNTRKPVGQASIELIFDNSIGTLGGEYAKYAQIALRRQVNRDGQSGYFINNVRCRRRDITDIFLGTGLGPRSYAIIEQGMIAKFIDSKPEELRTHLEEVAGISRYKERRRETENRIRATKENLNRISDLCEEVAKQVEKAKRQSRAAIRYKELKGQERLLKAQLLTLKCESLDKDQQKSIAFVNQCQTLLESHHAQQQSIDTEVEKQQQAKISFNDELGSAQSHYYTIGNEIAKLEQSIGHQQERYQQLELDLEQTENAWQASKDALIQDKEQLIVLTDKITEIEPLFDEAYAKSKASRQYLLEAEQQMQQWQNEWDEINVLLAQASEVVQVQNTRIQHLEEQQDKAQQKLVELQEELTSLTTAEREQELAKIEETIVQASLEVDKKQHLLQEMVGKINQKRQTIHDLNTELHHLRNNLHNARGRYASLEALQQAALGKRDGELLAWLDQHQLKENLRLAQGLQVESGWEKAVEMVLGNYLEAICVKSVDAVATLLDSLEQGSLSLFEFETEDMPVSFTKADLLSSKINADWGLKELLYGVYIADTLDDALKIRKNLSPDESVITTDGIWLGRKWLRISRTIDEKTGMLQREEELRELGRNIEDGEESIQQILQSLKKKNDILEKLECDREQLQQELSQAKMKHANISAQAHVKQAEIEQILKRETRLDDEKQLLHELVERTKQELQDAQQLQDEASVSLEDYDSKKQSLLQKRNEYQTNVTTARDKVRHDRDEAHKFELDLQAYKSRFTALEQAIERIQSQLDSLKKRREQLTTNLSKDDSPIAGLKLELETSLEKHVLAEKDLSQAKKKSEEFEYAITSLLQKRHQVEQDIELSRNDLEDKRLHHQELKVKHTALQEQLAEFSFTLDEITKDLASDVTEKLLTEEIEKVRLRISRLGPINLAAIDEHKEFSQRKEYLDSQYADLVEALDTLQNAIRKIDKETRSRFKETFDAVNNIFQNLFPRIFGGGSAYLELTGEDLLETGVSLMARPPGKRISSIHLLSGGEKALTAIALVFSLFQLKPAPFCLLDEVDAPLDDINIRRFCDLVKEMSKKVQFIFISHNKLAFEMANHLMGVTMSEPGVSRIVAVDVDEAVTIAEAS